MANDEEDHALVAKAPTEFALMANTTTENKVFDNSLCSKDCKENNDSLNSKITDLTDELFDANNMIYHYKTLEFYDEGKVEYIETLKKEPKILKQEKEVMDGKLASLLSASKNLDNLIASQRSDKSKEGLGYTAVPPPVAQLYLSPKKDLSWIGLPECADDTVTDYSRPSPTVESSSKEDQNRNPSASENVASPITPKQFVKFVKASDSQSKSKTDEKETPEKPTVKNVKQYRKPNKKPNVRGNQRNWNNLKSHQLGPNFVMKKKACFNCGDFNHLAYECIKRVKRGTTRS
nr:ubiquitin hydrolase [Tanacetum cinerariifolium]